MSRVRVAIAGVGNCASAFIQGIAYAREKGEDSGVITWSIGGYRPWDIDVVAAFDVSRRKVGKPLKRAIFEKPNITPRIADVEDFDVIVKPGPVLDGVAPHMVDVFDPIDYEVGISSVVDELKSSRAEVLVNLLPVGSEEATRAYAGAALEAGSAFVNGIPVFIASDPTGYWPRLYRERGLPLLGDDVKGQLGATILHQTLVSLMSERGVKVEETYQLNIGGNTDFLNMLAEERLTSKRISKTRAVTSKLKYGGEMEEKGRVRIGPSDYIPFLGNTKKAYIYVKGRSFLGMPVTIEATLTVDDKSMCSAVLIDVVRWAKVALENGWSGPLYDISAKYFKHPFAPRESTHVS